MKRDPASRIRISIIILMTCFILTVLLAGNGHRDIVQADTALKQVASGMVYLPVVNKPVPIPSAVNLVPFATDFADDTITDIAHAGDDRLFVLEREGLIRIVQPDGSVLPTPFLDFRGRVADPVQNWELGALGIVFHPNFPTVPYVYVSYTSNVQFRIHLDRYTVNPATPNVADVTSRLLMLQIKKTGEDDSSLPVSPVHNGGDLAFGPDGYLYIGTGDGGPDPHFGSTTPHDPANHGQRTDVLLGKILRIDVDENAGLPPTCDSVATTKDGHYSIPADNPLVGTAVCHEIWATGLRNPWRFSFDADTDDLYISDVGEWFNEEINFEPAGTNRAPNYGWRCWEGSFDQTIDHPIYADRCDPPASYDFPVFEYSHAATLGCSITGGFVYRGSQYPTLNGYYIYSDFCSGQIWILRDLGGTWQNFQVGHHFYVSTFGEDVNGELYAGTWAPGGTAVLYKVVVP